MISRVPITVVAPLVVGVPVLVVGVWLSVMWNQQSRDAVTQLADRNIEQIQAMAATKVADELSIPLRICQLNEHLITSGALDPADLASWRPTLVREADAFDMLSAISGGSADGRTAWVSRYADGSFYWAVKDDPTQSEMSEWRVNVDRSDDNIADDESADEESGDDESGDSDLAAEPSSTFDFDLFSRPWYQAPRDARRPTWSEPYVWVGGVDSAGTTLGISYGIPLYDDAGGLLGVIDADFSLNDLSTFLRSIEIGKTGMAVLMTGDNKLLAASSDVPLVDDAGERIDALASSDPVIVAAAKFAEEQTDDKSAGHSEIVVDGNVHFIRASSVGDRLGLDWTLLTIIPEQDSVADIEAEFRRSWIASLAGVALALMVGLVAARWLVAPLVKVVTAVRRIGQGDLETRVEIHHAPEYMKLAEEINEMTVGLQDRLRMRESLSLAMEVQKNLLPSESPSVKRLDIAGHSTYCDETGGDYYDFLDVSGADDETAVIAVGDVMGHGVAAAMLMATARGILRSRCSVPGSLADFLSHLNEMLVPDTQGERFMTMLLITVSATRDELRWASAGHGPPMIYDADADRFLDIDGGGLPLGLFDEAEYDEYVESGVKAGFIILAATDGVCETKGEDGELFGNERLERLVRQHARRTSDEISEAIRDAVAQFRGPSGQDDDVTFVIAKVV
ncbi:MAG: SpoIIE family protein phosphatase [Pirellulales bacterium]